MGLLLTALAFWRWFFGATRAFAKCRQIDFFSSSAQRVSKLGIGYCDKDRPVNGANGDPHAAVGFGNLVSDVVASCSSTTVSPCTARNAAHTTAKAL